MSGSTASVVKVKLAKSAEFLFGAEVLSDDAFDATVSLAASAAINAADVLQLLAKGGIQQGKDHAQATSVLRKAGYVRAASHLSYCLSTKQKAQYASKRCTASEASNTVTRATRLLEQARELAREKGYLSE